MNKNPCIIVFRDGEILVITNENDHPFIFESHEEAIAFAEGNPIFKRRKFRYQIIELEPDL